jgi:hypothetical protein
MPITVKRHVLFLLGWLLTCPVLPAQEPNRNILFGMPSPAKADPEQREDYLIARPSTSIPTMQRRRRRIG